MPANNWRECPKCVAVREDKLEAMRKKLDASYGKVSRGEYRLAEEALRAKEQEKPKVTLREDYQVGMDEGGGFHVEYSCSCTVCDFEWQYRHDEDVLVEKGGA